jgi:hypothetical protein
MLVTEVTLKNYVAVKLILYCRGVVGPEGFPLAHTEEAEEEATRRACTFAHQVQYRGRKRGRG